jgi:Mn2+/Fe2+ NRAMP family transporter
MADHTSPGPPGGKAELQVPPARRMARRIGPKMLAGASDNDPTNVGTAVVVGAQTGYTLSWVALLVAPLLAIVQAIAAHVGIVARDDLQALTVRRYGRRVGAVLALSVVVVNVVTIAADLQAGAAGIGLLAGIDPRWIVLPLGLALVGLLMVGRYDEVVAVLRYLLLGFLAFGATAVLAHPDWSLLWRHSVVPTLSLNRDQVAGSLALLGTTLTSYVYVWETVQRGVEEPIDSRGGEGLRWAKIGAVVSAVFTSLVLWFMVVTSAATLGRHHPTVASAHEAALALRPLAGSAATDLFSFGLVISAVVALPVLMASTAYVVGAQFDWRRGLSQGIRRAPAFYGVLAASIGLGVATTLAGVSVLGMLVAASIIGGIGTPIGLVLLLRLGRDPRVMGDRPISARLAIAGWMVAVVIGTLGAVFVLGEALGIF